MIFLDTEQTGTKDNRVCQIAYLSTHNGNLIGRNEFFQVDRMNEHALEAHGLSISRLERLSGHQSFEDKAASILEKLDGHTIVGHNISCDLRVLRSEFARCGMTFKPSGQFCTMKHFAPIMNIRVGGSRKPKDPSLAELCKYLNVSEDMIMEAADRAFGCKTRAHDARYDACATHLCVEAAIKTGMLRGLIPESR